MTDSRRARTATSHDCVEGIVRLMRSNYREPLNLGTDRLVSINELVDIVASIAGKRIEKRYDLSKPQGVRGRNSDNARLREVLGWEPQVSLESGLARTYEWIREELSKDGRLREPALSLVNLFAGSRRRGRSTGRSI